MTRIRVLAILALVLPLSLQAQAPQPGAAAPAKPPAPAAQVTAAATRAEFVALVADHFQWVHWSDYIDQAKKPPRRFHDVKTSDRYGRQIECALEEGIVGPDLQQNFRPAAPVTRAEAASILAAAFTVPESDVLSALPAGASLSRDAARQALAALVSTRVAPVQAMPKSGTTSFRRAVNLTTPTAGAVVYYTMTTDRSEPADPVANGKAYDPIKGYLNLDVPMSEAVDQKVYTIKAVAKKDGLAVSGVRTFVYHIVRPQTANWVTELVHVATSTSPAVWNIWNPSDYNRPHEYYIEGTTRGVLIDAGQYPAAKGNLKPVVDAIATKPYDVVLGHNNPDHVEQIDSFVQAGVRLYLSPQDKGQLLNSKRPDFVHAAEGSTPIHYGDVLDLGNVQMTAYQVPGHEHGLVILADRKNGWVFGSDMFGCNRPATADITQYSGMKMDLFLSTLQQLYANLLKDGGRITEVYNAHQEAPVGYPGIMNFQRAVQQLLDSGEKAASPSLRSVSPGGQPFPKPQRMSIVGDMWRDKDWIAIWTGGFYGDPVDYLTKPSGAYPTKAAIDYNQPEAYRKYAVLGNLEVDGGRLVGVDLTWAPPANGVPHVLPNMFDPWTFAYDVVVPAGTRTISVAPTSLSKKVTALRVDGVAMTSGARRSVAVIPGKTFTVDVVAQDGVTTGHYVFTMKAGPGVR